MSEPIVSGRGRVPTVVIAAATTMDCQLLSDTMQTRGRFQVLECATNSTDLLEMVSKLEPDLALISNRLQPEGKSTLDLVPKMHALKPYVRVVLLVDDAGPNMVVEAFRCGVRGIFCRNGVSSGLRKCMQAVHEGQIWVSNQQLEYLIDALAEVPETKLPKTSPRARLSKREEQIVRLVGAGLSNGEVAQKLGISPHTVKNNLFRIFDKLGVSTRIELVFYALSQRSEADSKVANPPSDRSKDS